MSRQYSLNYTNRLISTGVLMALCLLIVSCSTIENTKNKYFPAEEKQEQEEFTCDCPVCPDPNAAEPDKVVYAFEKHKEILFKFFEYSKEINCVFSTLEDPDIANALINANKNGFTIRLIFDRQSFTNCDVQCLPKLQSSYNDLVRNGIKVKVGSTPRKYCVSDQGIYFYTGNYDSSGIVESHVVYSKELAVIYKENFMKLYNG